MTNRCLCISLQIFFWQFNARFCELSGYLGVARRRPMSLRINIILRLDLKFHFLFVDHFEMILVMPKMMMVLHCSLVFEFLFNLLPLLHKQVKEIHALFLHVFFVFVDEYRLHNQFVKPVKVFEAAFVAAHVVLLRGGHWFFFVGVQHFFVVAFFISTQIITVKIWIISTLNFLKSVICKCYVGWSFLGIANSLVCVILLSWKCKIKIISFLLFATWAGGLWLLGCA